MLIGYIRVSDRDQNPGRQIEKLNKIGIDERYIFVDKQTGKNFNRPAYQAMKKIIRKGDLIYLDALDRLGRDYDGIIREWKEITRSIGVDIIVLEQESLFDSQKFRTMGDLGKLLEDQFLSLLSYVADQEREKIRRRQREGIDLALSNGIKFGRPRKEITKIFVQTFNDWKKGNITAVKAMHICEMKPSTFYRRAKEYEDLTNSKEEQ